MRAWGPSTGSTACALAGRRCSLWGWRKGVPGGGAFHRYEGRLRSGAPPPPTARPLGGLLRPATHVLWARVCGCGGPTSGLWEFLLNSINTTNLFGEEVINVLDNLFCQTPQHRNLLNEVQNKKVNGDHRQICAQQLINGVPSVVCTPTDAVQLLVDLRVPRNRYAILRSFMTHVGTTFSAKARID